MWLRGWVLALVQLGVLAKQRDYCIIGAGPAGLQIAHFLQEAKRDYVLFERSNVTGSFYHKFPRHGQLISINKRHTGSTNREFNLRHDWNSLLSVGNKIAFTNYSKDYFPKSRLLAQYLDDFRRIHDISVQFNVNIRNLRPSELEGCRFAMEDQNNTPYCCRNVILGTGIAVPVIPKIDGAHHMVGYEDISTNRDVRNIAIPIKLGGEALAEIWRTTKGNPC